LIIAGDDKKEGSLMTLEEERYLEECRRRLKPDQTEAAAAAIHYGIPLEEIQKIAQKNLNGEQMQQIIFAVMENVGGKALDFLLEHGELNHYQLKEVSLGFIHGLSFEQVKSYAGKGTNAHQMKKMRLQLEASLARTSKKEDGMEEYMQGLMKIMEESIQQFKESNERFDALALLVKEHVVEEKNNEIKDLYKSLQGKDEMIRKLKQQLAEKEKEIRGLKNHEGQEQTEKMASESIVKQSTGISAWQDGKESRNKRLAKWLGLMKKDDDILGQLLGAEFSPEQMEEVKKCVEQGLDYQEVTQIIKAGGTPEKMQKLREIILLMKARKAGA